MLRFLPLLLLSACLTPVPQRVEVVLQADESRLGAQGTDGPFAVAKTQLDVQARVVDSFLIHVFFAWNQTETPKVFPSTVPLLVLLQERGVAVERYFWLAQHFASRGYPTVVVDHFADAPLVESDNGALALENMRRVARFNGPMKELVPENVKGVIIGHGEGGRAAQDLWRRYPQDFDDLMLLGARALVPTETRDSGRVLCVGGSNDKYTAGMLNVCRGFPSQPVPDAERVCFGSVCRTFSNVTMASITGVNHYLFADDLLDVEKSDDGLLGDGAGPQSESLEGLRLTALAFIDAWLDASLRNDSAAAQSIARCQALAACEASEGCETRAACSYPGAVVTP
jgi:hypothetical protein